jgi:hypothetical protein
MLNCTYTIIAEEGNGQEKVGADMLCRSTFE